MLNHVVTKPEHRGFLRKYLGKEYFILKRKLKYVFGKDKYVSEKDAATCDRSVITHRSFLLRPLKDVDMVLQHNKVTNLRLAIAHIDRIVIKPGKTFSIWKLVGRPTKRKGYLEGLILHNGQIGKGIGGGLCQLGNLLYWMALHTDLDVTERWRHGYDVFPDINRTIPFACGATLSYNYVDLQLTNNTENTYQIHLWLDDEYLNGEILCNKKATHHFEIVETDHQINLQWWGGYTRHNRIWKQKINGEGELIGQELVAENHAIMMYEPLLTESLSDAGQKTQS